MGKIPRQIPLEDLQNPTGLKNPGTPPETTDYELVPVSRFMQDSILEVGALNVGLGEAQKSYVWVPAVIGIMITMGTEVTNYYLNSPGLGQWAIGAIALLPAYGGIRISQAMKRSAEEIIQNGKTAIQRSKKDYTVQGGSNRAN